MNPAADIRVEVEIGVERESALLHHRPHPVTEDPEDLGRGLDGAGAVWHLRLAEVVRERLIDEPLVVVAGARTWAGGRRTGLGIEAAEATGEVGQFLVEAALLPMRTAAARAPRRRRRRSLRPGKRPGRSSARTSRRTAAAAARSGRRPDACCPFARPLSASRASSVQITGLYTSVRSLPVTDLAVNGRPLRQNSWSSWLTAAGSVAQPAAVLDEHAAAPDRQRRHHIERDQSHSGHRDCRSRRRSCRRTRRPDTGQAADSHLIGLVRRMAGGHDHVVDDDRSPVGQPHLLAAVAPGDDVDRRRWVMNDVHARRRAVDERPVEPPEVLAHQAARQEMVPLDRLARRDRSHSARPPTGTPARRPSRTDQARSTAGQARSRTDTGTALRRGC